MLFSKRRHRTHSPQIHFVLSISLASVRAVTKAIDGKVKSASIHKKIDIKTKKKCYTNTISTRIHTESRQAATTTTYVVSAYVCT